MAPRVALRDGALSLRDFMHRAKVLKSYRDFMRELKGVDAQVQAELRGQIRAKYRASMLEKNRATINARLTDATRELQMLRQYIGGARLKAADAAAAAGAPTGPDGTWVGTGDADDIKGRVGESWPWGQVQMDRVPIPKR